MNQNKTRGFCVVAPEHRAYPDKEIILPKRATARSACYDIYSPIDAIIYPGKIFKIQTDVCAYMQPDEVLLAFPRSSMGKHPVRLANTTGVIDADFAFNETNGGNMQVALHNLGNEPYAVHEGDRICQVMFTKYLIADVDHADGIRTGGIGSTGK